MRYSFASVDLLKVADRLLVVTLLKVNAVAGVDGAAQTGKLGGKCTPKRFASSSSIAF